MKALLEQLLPSFPMLGDVRGQGLMLGVEVVRCPHSKAPAPRLAVWIKERAKVRVGAGASKMPRSVMKRGRAYTLYLPLQTLDCYV